MKKEYKIKKTKKLIKKLQPYWKELDEIQNEFFDKVNKLERKMEKETGIEGIEIFYGNGGVDIVGIGNVSRTMELIHSYELMTGKLLED